MNQDDVENALHAWVKKSSGYDGSKVIWDSQGGARPVVNFITLRLGVLIVLGVGDNVSNETDLSRPPGEEIEIKVEGPREFSVLVQAFTHEVIGSASGRAVLARVQSALNMPSVIEAFQTAGIASIDPGGVQNAPAILGTSFEGRALLEVRFNAVDSTSEFTGYINTVSGAGNISGQLVPGDTGFTVTAT